jgi:hypothetical protein
VSICLVYVVDYHTDTYTEGAPGGFFPPPPSINGTQPGNHGNYSGGQNGGPGGWLPVPGNGQQPGGK